MEIDGVFAFTSFEELTRFVNWVTTSFETHEEFEEWLELRTSEASTIDSDFWHIIENGYYMENHDTDLPGSD